MLQMDLFERFETVMVSKVDQIDQLDRNFCELQQKKLSAALAYLKGLIAFHKANVPGDPGLYIKNKILWVADDAAKAIPEALDNFVEQIIRYFEKKYHVDLDADKIKSCETITWEQVVDGIIDQLGGLTFTELVTKQLKEKSQEFLNRWNECRIEIKGKRISIPGCVRLEEHYFDKDKLKIAYSYREEINLICTALTHFDHGVAEANHQFNWYLGWDYLDKDTILSKTEIHMDKIKSFRLFKNGKIDVEFASSEYAEEFAREYGGWIKTN